MVVDNASVVLEIVYVPVLKVKEVPATSAYVLDDACTELATKVLVLKVNAKPLVVAKLDVVALTALVTTVLVLKFRA